MRIEVTSKLSEEKIKEIEQLQKVCNDTWKLENRAFLSNEINFDKTIPCFYLYYQGDKLVSFLTTFMPEVHEVEIIAFTHPKYCQKGCFSEVFQRMLEIIKSTKISNLLFAIESNSQSGKAVLNKFSTAKWKRSEYRMLHTNRPEIPKSIDLQYHLLTEENKLIFQELSEVIFKISEDNNFTDNAIESEDREGYIAYYNGIPIGIFNLNYQDNTTFIYGVGIMPSYQHNGYGKQLLGQALNIAYTKTNKAILDVDSNNPIAYNLYLNSGFKVCFQVDYFNYVL
ncbi:hypothetical protein UT300005_10530 [Clostridium sp. CTA-5]